MWHGLSHARTWHGLRGLKYGITVYNAHCMKDTISISSWGAPLAEGIVSSVADMLIAFRWRLHCGTFHNVRRLRN